jgi:hypothetical protein
MKPGNEVTTREELKNRLNKILKDDLPLGIMIKGEWGIGKTHFWKEFINEFQQKNKDAKTAYISLFEAESLKEVRKDILVQLYTKKVPFRRKLLKLFKLFRIDFNQTAVELKIPYLNLKLPLKISASIENLLYLLPNNLKAIICFDEFERLNLNKIELETLLGIISFFKENNSCKVIIIVNEKEFESKLDSNPNLNEIYNKYKEKIVDYEFTLNPTFEENFAIASRALKLKDYEPILQKIVSELQVNNLRILNNLIRIINEFEFINNSDFNIFRKEVKEVFIEKLATLTLKKFQDPTKFKNENEKDLYEYVIENKSVGYFENLIVRYLDTGYINKKLLHNVFLLENAIFENFEKRQNLFKTLAKIYDFKVPIQDILNEIWDFLENEKDNILSILSISNLATVTKFILIVDPSSKKKCVNYAVTPLKKFVDDNYDKILDNKIEEIEFMDYLSYFPDEIKTDVTTYLTEKKEQLKATIGKEHIETAIKKILSGGWGIKDEEVLFNSDPKKIIEYMKSDPEFAELIFRFLGYIHRLQNAPGNSKLKEFLKNIKIEIQNDPESYRFELIKKIRGSQW